MHRLTEQQWTAIAAHRLHYHWRRLDLEQVDELASELWQDERLRMLDPEAAADAWLAPMTRRPS